MCLQFCVLETVVAFWRSIFICLLEAFFWILVTISFAFWKQLLPLEAILTFWKSFCTLAVIFAWWEPPWSFGCLANLGLEPFWFSDRALQSGQNNYSCANVHISKRNRFRLWKPFLPLNLFPPCGSQSGLLEAIVAFWEPFLPV